MIATFHFPSFHALLYLSQESLVSFTFAWLTFCPQRYPYKHYYYTGESTKSRQDKRPFPLSKKYKEGKLIHPKMKTMNQIEE
jgi:hypothetical protein